MIKLNIGCGNDIKLGFVNIDIKSPADILMDVCKEPLPFDDNSVDEVYSCHAIEHFEDIEFVIRETYRVLKKEHLFILHFPHFTQAKAHHQYHRHYLSSVIMDFYDKDSNVKRKRLNIAKFKVQKRIMVYRHLLLPHTYLFDLIAKFAPNFYEAHFCYLAPAYNIRLTCKKE